jgi:hypothetical protein
MPNAELIDVIDVAEQPQFRWILVGEIPDAPDFGDFCCRYRPFSGVNETVIFDKESGDWLGGDA